MILHRPHPSVNDRPHDGRSRPPRFCAHVPTDIDFAAVAGRPGWVDYAKWVVGAVVFQRYRVHDLTADDWCPLGSGFVRAFVPCRVWVPLRDRLVGAGVLEWDRHCRPPTRGAGGKCYYFRVGRGWRHNRVEAHQLRNPELVNRMVAYRRRERAKVTDPVLAGLRRWVERMEVLPEAPFGDPVLDRIRLGDHWFAVCEQGRVHTPATNLAREFRPHVRVAGQKVVSVDVSCSQPLVLAAVAGGPTPGRGRSRGEGHHPHYVPFVVQNSDRRPNDDFLADCLSARLYERFVGAWGLNRDATKVAVLALVYGYPKAFVREHAAAFRSLYPSTWDRISQIATALPHGELARMMQRAESDLMIRGVAARFLREHPRTPVLTVHDALLVPPWCDGIAEALIRDEWRSRYGIEPRVKVSPWTGERRVVRDEVRF